MWPVSKCTLLCSIFRFLWASALQGSKNVQEDLLFLLGRSLCSLIILFHVSLFVWNVYNCTKPNCGTTTRLQVAYVEDQGNIMSRGAEILIMSPNRMELSLGCWPVVTDDRFELMSIYRKLCVLCLLLQGAVSGSVQASDRLMKELREIYRSQSYKTGMQIWVKQKSK